MFKKLRQNTRGDTIVEVLISLAILTMVLGGAYYTANQSFRNDRDAQEHSEALTIAQTQVESLRILILGNKTLSGNPCIVNGNSSSSCQVASNDTSSFNIKCPTSAPYCYTVNITDEGSVKVGSISTLLTTYKVNVSWPALSGGKDQVSLYYRVDN